MRHILLKGPLFFFPFFHFSISDFSRPVFFLKIGKIENQQVTELVDKRFHLPLFCSDVTKLEAAY